MIFIELELNNEQIEKDHIIKPNIVNEIIEKTFKSENCFVFRQMGNVSFWTRNMNDDKDLESLWLVQSAFRQERWFKYYVKKWNLIIMDDSNTKVTHQEDIISEWIPIRPDKP